MLCHFQFLNTFSEHVKYYRCHDLNLWSAFYVDKLLMYAYVVFYAQMMDKNNDHVRLRIGKKLNKRPPSSPQNKCLGRLFEDLRYWNVWDECYPSLYPNSVPQSSQCSFMARSQLWCCVQMAEYKFDGIYIYSLCVLLTSLASEYLKFY